MKAFLRGAAAVAAIASFGVASSASAATTATANVNAVIDTALSVTVVSTDNALDFGTIADGGITSNATLTLAAGASALSTPCALPLICSGTPNTPTFNVVGISNRAVNVSFQNATETLTGPGGATMQVNAFTTSAAQLPMTTGTGSFSVGGTLTVAPAQAAGSYAGTLRVNVAYQ